MFVVVTTIKGKVDLVFQVAEGREPRNYAKVLAAQQSRKYGEEVKAKLCYVYEAPPVVLAQEQV